MRSLVWNVVAAFALATLNSGCNDNKPDMASQNKDKSGSASGTNPDVKLGGGEKSKKPTPEKPPPLLPPPP